jgi:hypothetical protein
MGDTKKSTTRLNLFDKKLYISYILATNGFSQQKKRVTGDHRVILQEKAV